MKTCIFGGTFDPPHIGHLLIAQTIIESENFERLIFVPANISPAKQGKTISSSKKMYISLKLLSILYGVSTHYTVEQPHIGSNYTRVKSKDMTMNTKLQKQGSVTEIYSTLFKRRRRGCS